MKQLIALILIVGSCLMASAKHIEKLAGTVGNSKVTMTLNFDEAAMRREASQVDVEGTYSYTKVGQPLYLYGTYKPFSAPNLTFVEKTKAGKETGYWELYIDNNGYYGTMTNSKGKTFKVRLRYTK